MPVTTAEQPTAIQHSQETALYTVISMIVEHCFDANLLERQGNIHRYHGVDQAPIAPKTQITLGAVAVGTDRQRTTNIGNVESIMGNSKIAEGAHIGDGTTIHSRVVIESGATIDPYCYLDHGVRVGAGAIIDRGARLLVQSSVEANGHIAEGVEVNYDRTVTASEVMLPFSVLS